MGKNAVKFKGIDFTGVLQTIGMQKSTGVLRIDGGKDTHFFIFIERGRIVGADTFPKRLDERLGNILMLQGYIDREELSNAIKLQKSTKKKLGQVLVKYGLVDEDVVENTLRRQIERIFFKLYTSPIQKYVFETIDEIEEANRMIKPIPIENFILEIAANIDELPEIRKEISSDSVVFEASTDFDRTKVELVWGEEATVDDPGKLTSVELHVLNLIDGINPVERILLMSSYDEFTTLKALCSLKKKGAIVMTGEEKEIETIIKSMERQEIKTGSSTSLIIVSILIIILSILSLTISQFSLFCTYFKDFSSYFLFK